MSEHANDPELTSAIQSIAMLVDDELAWRRRAALVAQQLGPDTIPALRNCVNPGNTPPPPPGFSRVERGLGAWVRFWQFAVFEVLYHFRERSIPVLREFAFGKYDWTQANGIEVLCRLAAEDIERERTLGDLRKAMPALDYNALLYAVTPLRMLARSNPQLDALIGELRGMPEFDEAIREIEMANGPN